MGSKPIDVLLVEDNPGDAELVRLALSKNGADFKVHWAKRFGDAKEHLLQQKFDVVLLDLSLPDSQGLETVTKLRSCDGESAIVVLTSLDSPETALDSFDEGAQDYLAKQSINPDTLQRVIRYAMQRQRNYAQTQRLLAQVQGNQRLLERKNRRLAKLYRTAHRFVDNVSHEFRTPLTVIKEYVSLLQDGLVGDLEDEQHRCLEVVHDRANDLANMVDDMLDVSKLEVGMLGLWRKACRVGDIFAHIRPDLERKAALKRVTLETALDADLPEVYCDPEKIGRVIVNLTHNAIKFAGNPGRVQIWSRRSDGSHDVLVGVTDNGPGIAEKDLPAVFDRFKQLNQDVRGSTKGFGLGLNIARELVHLNLGQMKAESVLGRGSTFSFTLPFAEPVEVVKRYLGYLGRLKVHSAAVSVVAVKTQPAPPDDMAQDVEAFLTYLLRSNDLLFSGRPGEWALVLNHGATELDRFFDRMTKTHQETNRNRPHGPLPELATDGRGTWQIADGREQILGCVRRVLESREAAHV